MRAKRPSGFPAPSEITKAVHGNPIVVDGCFQQFAELCHQHPLVKSQIAALSPDVLMVYMRRHVGRRDGSWEECMSFIAKLCQTRDVGAAELSIQLLDKGIIPVVLPSLHALAIPPDLQAVGATMLLALLENAKDSIDIQRALSDCGTSRNRYEAEMPRDGSFQSPSFPPAGKDSIDLQLLASQIPGVASWILATLVAYCHHEGVQEAGLALLARVCNFDRSQSHEAALSIVVSSLRQHHKQAGVQEAGVGCIASMCAGCAGIDNEAKTCEQHIWNTGRSEERV